MPEKSSKTPDSSNEYNFQEKFGFVLAQMFFMAISLMIGASFFSNRDHRYDP